MVRYVVVRRLLPSKIALLALVFMGWENVVIVFGAGFITQTPAYLMILVALFCYVVRQKGGKSQTSLSVLSIVALTALSTFSFASAILGIILFASVAGLSGFLRIRGARRAISFLLLLVVFFLAYVVYVSESPAAIFSSIAKLLREALAAQVVTAPSLGQDLYGSLVRAFTFFFWAFFLVAFPFFLT